MLASGSVMTVSDYIGKRVYDASGNDIGEVNDIILSAMASLQPRFWVWVASSASVRRTSQCPSVP